MLPKDILETIAQDPKKYLRQCHRLDARVRTKNARIARLYQVSTQITSSIKAVSAYTGPSDKTGNCVLEIVSLQKEIENEISDLIALQREIEATIRDLVPETAQRGILEARYLAGMTWEQIAYEYHYAYRWTLRLHARGLEAMKTEAERRLEEWDDKSPKT